ncbi:hypothetical protein Mycsm_06978 (plasmid) [Mycobacterium sp. JS623]|uniref:hypothetical protein n=1 Tax=Mycobacterium sp. JS623 TaxID=212767 RepID=UPI0002A57F5C|nr:hypothetical protein [Mycobacterium sp. JS623]AGB27079.1 hypothetical protein Mycsm_06978 [Mycobacterium sp. JS623]
MTNLEINASTTGYDDAEAIATMLELAATAVREAGGDPVDITDQTTTVSHDAHPQQVYWSMHFGG